MISQGIYKALKWLFELPTGTVIGTVIASLITPLIISIISFLKTTFQKGASLKRDFWSTLKRFFSYPIRFWVICLILAAWFIFRYLFQYHSNNCPKDSEYSNQKSKMEKKIDSIKENTIGDYSFKQLIYSLGADDNSMNLSLFIDYRDSAWSSQGTKFALFDSSFTNKLVQYELIKPLENSRYLLTKNGKDFFTAYNKINAETSFLYTLMNKHIRDSIDCLNRFEHR